MGESDEKSSSSKKDDNKNQPPWLAIVLTPITATAGIIAAIIAKSGTDDSKQASSTGAAPVNPGDPCVELLWVPSKCHGDTSPTVGIDTCADQRSLEWLAGEMGRLRNAQVFGFVDLPTVPKLEPEDLGSKTNQLLSVRSKEGTKWLVSVGYHNETRTNDGYLRMYDLTGHLVSNAVCLTKAKAWRELRGTTWATIR